MSKYPYRDAIKVIRVIESCKTLGQLKGVANKMFRNFMRVHGYTNGLGISYVYENKLKELCNESV